MVKHNSSFNWNNVKNFNFYPLNIFIHGFGAFGWALAGYLSSDRAILTNFGLQIPLFLMGYINLLQ